MKAPSVATVVLRSSVAALTNGATSGPVAPTNIVTNDAKDPIPIKAMRDGRSAFIAGPHRV